MPKKKQGKQEEKGSKKVEKPIKKAKVVKEKKIKTVEKPVNETEEIIVPEMLKSTEEEIIPKDVELRLAAWRPKTQLGKDVFSGKIKSIDEILESGVKIKEPQIIDFLVPNLKNELVMIGGRPGKGGGIQRTPIRMTAKMHRSGRRISSSTFVIVGNSNGIIGVGKGRCRRVPCA